MDGKIYKVCVHKDQVGGAQLVVVLEEQAGRYLRTIRNILLLVELHLDDFSSKG